LTTRPVQWQEQLQDTPARTQFWRALAELEIEWIAAQTPQAKGRIERLFGTLQNRLVKEMRLAEIATVEQANRYLEITFWPFWDERFTAQPAQTRDAHRSLQRTQRLEQILSVRVARTVAPDHTVSWKGERWGARREEVCAGPRGARAEIEGGLTVRTGCAFATATCRCRLARPRRDPQILPAYGLQGLRIANPNLQPKSKPTTARLPITLRENPGSGHFYFALTEFVSRSAPALPSS